MFTKIYIDNYMGISSPIELEFISKSRGRENNAFVYKTEDGIYINKMIGIIGGNASGKTSIVGALNSIGSLLIKPILQFNIEDKFEELQELLEQEENSENRRKFTSVMEDYTSSIDIRFQNLRRANEDTTLRVEMYITSENVDLTGYYTYEIVVNSAEKNVKKEIFTFRKKYKSKEEYLVDIENAKEGQVYYINRFSSNLNNIVDISNDKKEKLERQKQYISCFVKHYIEHSEAITTSQAAIYKDVKYIDWYKKSEKEFTSLAKLVDPKISHMIIDTDRRREELHFVLKDGSEITRNLLSTGTDRFLMTVRLVNDVIEKKGVILIDEIEMNLHRDLAGTILRLFGCAQKNNSQIIFTTLSAEIFDMLDENHKKIFKQDMICVLDSVPNGVKVDKLIDLKVAGQRVKGDASATNLYKDKKIAIQPDMMEINDFLVEYISRLL